MGRLMWQCGATGRPAAPLDWDTGAPRARLAALVLSCYLIRPTMSVVHASTYPLRPPTLATSDSSASLPRNLLHSGARRCSITRMP